MFLKSPLIKSYPITSKYGLRKHPILGIEKMHNGIDIGCPEGTPIFAPIEGTVYYSTQVDKDDKVTGYGKFCKLFFITEQGTKGMLLFGHLSSFDFVSGSIVKRGSIICRTGNTGLSTAPHCHLGLMLSDGVDYTWKNPLDYINLA